MKGLLDRMEQGNGLKDLLQKIKVDDKLKDDPNVSISFSFETGDIYVKSKQMTGDGQKPLYEWKMNPDGGEIEEIERNKDNSSEKVVVL